MPRMGRKAKKSWMKPQKFLAIRKQFELGQHDVAKWLDVSVNAISAYELGATPIPKTIYLLMRLVESGDIEIPKTK